MKSHRTDSVSLFFGLAFLMIALGYLAKIYLKLNLPSMGWFIAAGLIFLGIVGAITALVPSRQSAPVEQTSGQPASEQPSDRPSDRPLEQEREQETDAEQAR